MLAARGRLIFAWTLVPYLAILGVRLQEHDFPSDCPPGSECPTFIDERDAFVPPQKIQKRRQDTSPLMFVAVFTAQAHFEHRNAVRVAWHVPTTVIYRFVVCARNHTDSRFTTEIVHEAATHGDIMLLQCDEGYGQGLLTRKSVATMEAFLAEFPRVPYYFKTDDDTFPNLVQLLDCVTFFSGHIVAGIFYPEGVPAIRDKKNPWYEPEDVWPEKFYPRTPAGGPGYVLDAALVRAMIQDGIANKWMLWNEDRALAVWVKKLEESGVNISWIPVSGTDGYPGFGPRICQYFKTKVTTWESYKLTLWHHVMPYEMRCFHRVARPNNTDFGCLCAAP